MNSALDALCITQDLVREQSEIIAQQEARLRSQESMISEQAADIQRLKTYVEFERQVAQAAQEDSARLAWAMQNPSTFFMMTKRYAGEALIGLIDEEIRELVGTAR